jgi:hypothetical protein
MSGGRSLSGIEGLDEADGVMIAPPALRKARTRLGGSRLAR